jgi:hypothetical protein
MRVEPRAIATILSVLLHLLLSFALVRPQASADGPPMASAEHDLTADKLRGAGERIISVYLRPGLAVDGLACTGSSYIGVGITATPGSERIILVGDDTPASRAGLRHDDVVLHPAVWQDEHTEGALLRVVILREGVKRVVPVRVGKICIA